MTKVYPRFRARAKRGQALVPVIMVVLILTSLALAFTASSRRELKAASNFTSDAVVFNAARGAVNYAMSALGQISSNGYTYGIVPPGPDTDANGWMPVGDAWVKIDVIDTAACININNASAATLERMSVFGQNPTVADAMIDWRTPETTATSDGAKSDYYQGLTPPYNCKDAPYDTVEELLLVKGVTPTILYGSAAGTPISADTAQSNAQASSANGSGGGTGVSRQAGPRPNGAGQTMNNGAGQTINNGAGNTRPNGAGGNRPNGGGGGGGNGGGAGGGGGAAAAAAAGDTNWDDIYSSSTIPLSELFTTVSMERNIAADGTARVNINTASATDLQGIGISSNLANALIRARTPATGAGGGTAALGSALSGGGAATAPTAVSGRQALGAGVTAGNGAGITRPNGAGGGARPGAGQGAGGSGGGGAGGAGGGGGAGGASTSTFKTIADLLTVPGFSQTLMQQIADKVTVDDNQYHPNLVNINTAPAEVLATVPGMDHTTLNAITAYRQGGQAFQTMGDFFALQGLTRQEFQNVMASLCTKSSIYRVRIKVKAPGQQNIYAVTALVQMTDNGPQIIQWRETPRTPGWAYWVPSPVLPTPTTTTTSANVGQ